MGLLQKWDGLGAFSSGNGWWWSSPTRLMSTAARGLFAIFVFYWGFYASLSRKQYVYLYVHLYVSLI
jgi:hypothetical protein